MFRYLPYPIYLFVCLVLRQGLPCSFRWPGVPVLFIFRHSLMQLCLSSDPQCSRGLSGPPDLPSPSRLGISMPRYLLTVCLGHMRASVSFLYLAVGCPSLPLDVLQKRPSQKTTLTQPPTFVLSQGTCHINQRRHKKRNKESGSGPETGDTNVGFGVGGR